MKNKKTEYEAELAKLKSPRELQREELKISEKITGLERKIHYQDVEQVSTCSFIVFSFNKAFGACRAMNKTIRADYLLIGIASDCCSFQKEYC